MCSRQRTSTCFTLSDQACHALSLREFIDLLHIPGFQLPAVFELVPLSFGLLLRCRYLRDTGVGRLSFLLIAVGPACLCRRTTASHFAAVLRAWL